MTKFKKLKLRYYGMIALALALGVAGAYKGVSAYQSANAPQNLAEAGGTIVVNNNYEAPQAPLASEDPFLGAVTGPALPNPNCQNDLCTWTVVQTWQHATNTIFSIKDPFEQTTSTGGVAFRNESWLGWTGASSTIDLVRIYQTGAVTTTFGIACAPATSPWASGMEDAKRIVSTTVAIATSTLGIVENNLTAALGGRIDGGTVAKTLLGPQDPYFVCKGVPNDDGVTGINNADSAGAGYIVARFNRLRK